MKYLGVCLGAIVVVAACSGGSDGSDGSDGSGGSGANAGQGTTASSVTLGSACAIAEDCASPLICHHDEQDHVADGQCTYPCVNTPDCAPVGTNASCIGAHICVAKCSSNADCPARTRCGDEGWCERAGPGSGKPTCSGTATPCAKLSSSQCDTIYGCTSTGSCTGTPGPCGAITDVLGCAKQQGCSWTAGACTGSASPCSSVEYDFECRDDLGCTWTSGCTGASANPDCSEISATLCEFTPGCALMDQ
jgi:hypothetical protein